MVDQLVMNIGPRVLPDFVSGSHFYSILAYPSSEEVSRFHRLSNELSAGVIRLSREHHKDELNSVKEAWPQLDWTTFERLANKRRPALGTLQKRLARRMSAGRMGIAICYEEIFEKAPKLPAGVTARSLDQLAQLIRHDTTRDVHLDDPHSIERLVWRDSLPIIHLAIATQIVLSQPGQRNDPLIDIQDMGFVKAVVLLATDLEPVVTNHPKIRISSTEITQINWIE